MPSLLQDIKDLRRRSRAFIDERRSSRISLVPDTASQTVAEQPSGSSIDNSPAVYGLSNPTGPDTADTEDSKTAAHGKAGSLSGGFRPQDALRRRQTDRSSIISDRTTESQRTHQPNTYSISGAPPRPMASRSQSASPLAPRILSISDNSWVHQKVLLVYGQIGDANKGKPQDGNVTLHHHTDTFPPTPWPVFDLHFKALVVLQPGPNNLRFDYTPPRNNKTSSTQVHSTTFSINYLPLTNAPPLHLAIMVAKDSPCTFDATPTRIKHEGNGLDTAIAKFRMSAYLWQAFTGEQMSRNGFGRRCFRFEEKHSHGTLSVQDRRLGTMRNEAVVHVIKMNKTLKELRDPDVAQQHEPAKRKGDLYTWTGEALRTYFRPKDGQQLYVSCLLLDTHWDPKMKLVTAHAALGGANDPIHFGIFGSHALQSYPSAIEEVVPAFMDCTPTDLKYVANDANESGNNWEACNIGIGAHMHETGHALGCPHQEHGVMLRDYVYLNRTFSCREAFSPSRNSQGKRLVLQKDECGWHRLDCLRFRFHPAFRLPTDTTPPDGNVIVWNVGDNKAIATAASGIAFIEIYGDGDDLCRAWIDYATEATQPKQITLSETELRAKLPKSKQKKKLKLVIHSAGQGCRVIEDFNAQTAKTWTVKLPNGGMAIKGPKQGSSGQKPSTRYEVVFGSAVGEKKILTAVCVYAGIALDGLEFLYSDKTSQMFGKRGGTPNTFELDTRRGETLLGFFVRAGGWIDGLQVLTSTGRKSELHGNKTGGSGHHLIPPRGYNLVGVYGTAGQWADGFGIIFSR